MSPIRVNRTVTIPEDELRYSFTTSSGPGGQHANKVATRVTLTWDIASSRALGPRQRAQVRAALGRRVDSAGVVRLSSGRYRSQTRNRDDVNERLRRLLEEALRPRRRRVGTQPTRASVERRLRDKRRRAELKRSRGASSDD